LGHGLLEKAKILPVAGEQLRKQKVTDMTSESSDSIPRWQLARFPLNFVVAH